MKKFRIQAGFACGGPLKHTAPEGVQGTAADKQREGFLSISIRCVFGLHLCYKGFLEKSQVEIYRVWTRRDSNPYLQFRRPNTSHKRAHTEIYSTTSHDHFPQKHPRETLNYSKSISICPTSLPFLASAFLNGFTVSAGSFSSLPSNHSLIDKS